MSGTVFGFPLFELVCGKEKGEEGEI